ncbi:electron transfer flavoprotein subunit alpha/FixB family protein [Desulfosporosinus fructosivorans]
MNEYKNVWVFVEYANDKMKNFSLEILNKGNSLAKEMNEKSVAVIIGNGVENIAQQAAACGADEVILVEGEEYQVYNTDGYTNAMATLIGKYNPSVILFGSTNDAKDLAARVACRVKTGLVADCSAIDLNTADKQLIWTRPVLSGRALSKVVCRTKPEMATVRQGVYDRAQADNSKSADIVREEIKTSADQIRTKLVDFVDAGVTGIKLEDAEVVVSGGGGLGKAENVKLIQDLADLLGGAVGGSRASVDSEWLPPSAQIGQSGKTVSAKLYFGCGIAGAIQHLAGMSSSKCIVGINRDPDAPFFDIADYCVVGDLVEVLPAFIEQVRQHKAN